MGDTSKLEAIAQEIEMLRSLRNELRRYGRATLLLKLRRRIARVSDGGTRNLTYSIGSDWRSIYFRFLSEYPLIRSRNWLSQMFFQVSAEIRHDLYDLKNF